jgi:hypothetical protein
MHGEERRMEIEGDTKPTSWDVFELGSYTGTEQCQPVQRKHPLKPSGYYMHHHV